MGRLQNRPQSAGVNGFGLVDEFVDIGISHGSSPANRTHHAFYARLGEAGNVRSSPASPGRIDRPTEAGGTGSTEITARLAGGVDGSGRAAPGGDAPGGGGRSWIQSGSFVLP